MAVLQGAKIYASDYNVLQSTISTIMGTGTGLYGYNQSLQSSQIIATAGKYPPIKLSDWRALRNDILNAYNHIGAPGALPVPPNPTNANKVTATDYNNYLAILNATYAASTTTPPAGYASLVTLAQGVRTTSWNGIVTHNLTLTWPDSNSARGFFNSGSQIRISASLAEYPTDSSKAKNDDWKKMLSDMGTISLGFGAVTTTGSYNVILTPVNGVGGFYLLRTASQLIFQKGSTDISYRPNLYAVTASVNSAGTQLTLAIAFKDLDTGGPNVDENVEGTLTSTVQAYYSTGSAVQAVLPTVLSTGP
jgi:hypothetical protein